MSKCGAATYNNMTGLIIERERRRANERNSSKRFWAGQGNGSQKCVDTHTTLSSSSTVNRSSTRGTMKFQLKRKIDKQN